VAAANPQSAAPSGLLAALEDAKRAVATARLEARPDAADRSRDTLTHALLVQEEAARKQGDATLALQSAVEAVESARLGLKFGETIQRLAWLSLGLQLLSRNAARTGEPAKALALRLEQITVVRKLMVHSSEPRWRRQLATVIGLSTSSAILAGELDERDRQVSALREVVTELDRRGEAGTHELALLALRLGREAKRRNAESDGAEPASTEEVTTLSRRILADHGADERDLVAALDAWIAVAEVMHKRRRYREFATLVDDALGALAGQAPRQPGEAMQRARGELLTKRADACEHLGMPAEGLAAAQQALDLFDTLDSSSLQGGALDPRVVAASLGVGAAFATNQKRLAHRLERQARELLAAQKAAYETSGDSDRAAWSDEILSRCEALWERAADMSRLRNRPWRAIERRGKRGDPLGRVMATIALVHDQRRHQGELDF
jgi:hypothetical protein